MEEGEKRGYFQASEHGIKQTCYGASRYSATPTNTNSLGNFLRKISKISLWVLGITLGLLLVIFVLLQIPAVQQRVAREVEKIADNSLNGGELKIGKLDVDFFSYLELKDVSLRTPAGDTIASVGQVGVGINMLGLLQRKISISEVELADVYGRIITTDSTANISFLLPQGTTDTAPLATNDPISTGGAWTIDAAGTTLMLERADIFYQDDPSGILVDLEARCLAAKVEDIVLKDQVYRINYLDLGEANVRVGLRPTETAEDSTKTAMAMTLAAGRLTINESNLDLDMGELAVTSTLPYVNLEGGELALGETLKINGELFQLRDLALRVDRNVPTLAGPGIDYNHLHLTSIQAEATDLAYHVDSLHLRLRQLAAKEQSGFTLQKTAGTVNYNPSFLGLDNFVLHTPNSEINSAKTAVRYNFSSNDFNDMVAQLALQGYLGLRDVALLAPQLAQEPLIGNNLAKKITFDVQATGTMARLKLPRVNLNGPGVRVRATGQVENALDPKNINGKLHLTEFSILPGPLLPLIPDSLLPPDIVWPQRVVAEGTAEYRDDWLRLDFYAVENRTSGNALRSVVKTSGFAAGLRAYPATRLGLTLDTLRATRETILAYLPPTLLPQGYELPDYVRGSGTIDGPLGDLTVNLRLSHPGERTYASVEGNITNALQPDQLNLELAVSDLALNIDDIEAILPDSSLPSNLNLPDFRITEGKISGSPNNLQFDVPVLSDNGNWSIKGLYNPEDLNLTVNVQDVNPATLFTGALRDTLEQLQLGELNITAEVRGALEPALTLDVVANIGNDALGKFLTLESEIGASTYATNFRATHPQFRANGTGSYAITADSVAKVAAAIAVQRANLQYWEITQEPMVIMGEVSTDVEGLGPYDLNGMVRFDSITLRGAEGSSFVDSLVISATLDNLQNEIRVRSEVLDAELLGKFDPMKTPEKMVQFILAYWDETLRQPDPVENGESLDFTFQLKRPQPFTGGLINGLQEISPFKASLLYRDEATELLVNLELPKINFAGLEATDLTFRTISDKDNLNLEADWADISYNNQVKLGRTVLSGVSLNDQLLVELKLYTESDSLRHYLGLMADTEGDSLTLQLEQEQILNFETWAVPSSNLIAWAGPNLIIKNFALRNGEQGLTARTTAPGDVVVTLEDFDLGTLSRIVFSEEETTAGIVNGTVGIDNALSNLGIRSDLTVDKLKYGGIFLGDLKAEVTTNDEQIYQVNVALQEAGNNASLTGTVQLDGPLDLVLDVPKLQLTAAEPFSLGYLNKSEGYVSGRVDVSGKLEAPDLDGNLRFNDASLVVSLLGERFRLDDQPIRFDNSTVRFGDNWQVYDSAGGSAQVQGTVKVQSLTDIILDLRVQANDFLAINSTERDNKDWYGKMFVNGRVDIAGTAFQPLVDVTATTSKASAVTYVYRVPQEGLVEVEGIVDFSQQYQWPNKLRRDTLQADSLPQTTNKGVDLTLELDVDPNLTVTVIVDPVTGQSFTGKATGELTMQIYPDGRQEATGRVELVEGVYDFNYQNIINKEFIVLAGSNVTFTGDLLNPLIDLQIRHLAETAPLALVQGVLGEGAETSGLRRKQTFYVDVTLKGDLEASNITTDVVYPQDAYGNLGLSQVEDALSTLRQDQSRMTITAFQLLAFGSFNIPLLDSRGGGGNLAATTLNNLMSNYLNFFADQLVGFVDLDFGLDSYEDEVGQTQTNLRISLRKTLFDDRIIISVDGVAGTSEDELAGTQQTYLDNITAEYLINEDGTFRLKFFNDRDRSTLVGDNVIRFGGRLTFGKDFDRIRWFGKGKEE